jgi:hypothetical protein
MMILASTTLFSASLAEHAERSSDWTSSVSGLSQRASGVSDWGAPVLAAASLAACKHAAAPPQFV